MPSYATPQGRLVLSGGGYIGLLDLVPSAAAAYSVARKLRAAYTGSAIRLRRDSDDAESDFGFTGAGLLDTAAITAWLAGANGFVKTLYDQSGNGRDATQATTTAQPTYGGSVIGGKPAYTGDGGDLLLTQSFNHNVGTGGFWVSGVCKVKTGNFYSLCGMAGVGFELYQRHMYTNWGTLAEMQETANANVVLNYQRVGTTYDHYANGVLRQSQTISNSLANGVFGLSARGDGAHIGILPTSEVIFWPSSPSDANRNAVNVDMAGFYGITL